MRKPSLASAVFFSLVVSLALGCATTTGPGGPVSAKPEDIGPYECVDAGTTASPPPRAVLDLGMVRDSKTKVYRGRRKPLLTFRLCPRGKVPVSRVVALRAFPKGNPLLGLVEGTTEAFFTDREIGESIRRSRLPFEKVYTIPPGPDDQPHAVPPDPPGCNGVPSFGTCYYYGPAAYRRTADGGGMTMEIERPAFSGGGHSLDELAVQGGPGDGHIVELGWNVSPNQYGDGDPHLFVFHWINWSPTCYDGCGWQQYSATYFPRMNLRVLRGRDVYIGYVYYQGNWWAWFDNQWLGYFPGAEWSGGFTRSELVQWFGEVATNNGIPPNVEMGNGRFPTDPAAARNATLCDVDSRAWVCWYRDLQSLGPNFPPYYDIRRTGFGETRYGGPGR